MRMQIVEPHDYCYVYSKQHPIAAYKKRVSYMPVEYNMFYIEIKPVMYNPKNSLRTQEGIR